MITNQTYRYIYLYITNILQMKRLYIFTNRDIYIYTYIYVYICIYSKGLTAGAADPN